MFLLACLCLALQAAPADSTAPAPTYTPGRQVITARMIREAGLIRPSDLLLLADGWAFRSIDGFHFEATGGLSSPLPNRWSLWVDGVRVPDDLTGGPDLNLLAVSLHDIDSVEVVTGPAVFEGEWHGQGLIHVHTRRPRGIEVRAEYGQGNEVGDPGPLRFFGDVTNVDKLGPDLSATAAYGRRGFSARLSALSRDHHPTDRAILQRIQALTAGWPNSTVRGYSGQMDIGGRWGWQTVSVLASTAPGFMFVSPFGREMPADRQHVTGGLNGDVRIGAGLRLRHALQYGESRLTGRPNPLNVDPDWRRTTGRGLFELAYAGAAFDGALGVRGVRQWEQAERLGLDARSSAASVHGRVAFRPDERLLLSAAGQSSLRFGGGRGVILSGDSDVGGGHRLGAALSFGHRSPTEDHPLWEAIDSGYRLLDTLGVAYLRGGAVRQPVQAGVDLGWRRVRSGGGRYEAALEYRWTDRLILEAQELGADEAGPVFVGPVSFVDVAGHALGARLGARSTVGPLFRQHTWAAFRLAVGGDGPFQEAWRRWPAVLAQTSWTYAPTVSFSLTARLAYRSGTTWTNLDWIGGGFELSSPPAAMLDLSAVKTFWSGRIVADVMVRSATNTRYRLHPRGETQDLSLFARLMLRLGD